MALSRIILIGLALAIGISLAIITNYLGLNPMEFLETETELQNEEGRYYCWAIDSISKSEEYANATDFEKDLIIVHKKWCIDEPREKANLVMPNT